MSQNIVFPAAFTTEMEINDEVWDLVQERHKNSNSPDSMLCYFERELHSHIETKLREIDPDNSNIVLINFVNSSGKRIDKLK